MGVCDLRSENFVKLEVHDYLVQLVQGAIAS